MAAVELVFWVAIALIAYTLAGYPLLALALGRVAVRHHQREPVTPSMSLVIAAYNEEDSLAEKLEASLGLDYPGEKLEIVVADDGSTDRTPEIAESFSARGVRHHRCEGRLGKTATLNAAAAAASGEILVFSDATTRFSPGSLRAIAANFADPAVGCVSGRVTYHYGEDTTSSGFRTYQGFAVAVRRAEARFGSVTSVSGAIHGVRRTLFRPVRPEFTMDLSNPVQTVVAGGRVVYEDEAIGGETSRSTLLDEFRARIRNAVLQNAMVPWIVSELVSARRFAYLLQVASSKFLRWWLGPLLLIALISNLLVVGQGGIYPVFAGLQLAALAAAGVAVLLEAARVRVPGTASLAFFLVGNAGMCVGMWRLLREGGLKTWEPTR